MAVESQHSREKESNDGLQPEITYIDLSFKPGNTLSLQLYLSVDSRQFSAAVLDPEKKEFLALEQHLFSPPLSESELGNRVRKISRHSSIMNQEYQKVAAAYHTHQSTLIPEALFEEKDVSSYLEFNFGPPEDQAPKAEKLENPGVFHLYYLNNEVAASLRKAFPGLKIFHASSPVLDQLALKHKNNTEKEVYVQLQQHHLELFMFSEGKLKFYNSFPVKSKEDISYYILFSCEQAGIDPHTLDLKLFGEIQTNSPVVKLLEEYINQVSLIKPETDYKLAFALRKIPAHYYYHLFNLYQCG